MPKLLFPLVGKPIILWTLDMLRSFHVTEVVLAVNYLADQLRCAVGDTYKGMRIRYSLENTPLGTAGPIKLASRFVDFDETFIVMNGDIIAGIDLKAMLMHHQRTQALVTDALHEAKDPRRFGLALLDLQGRIKRFVEKPTHAQALSHLVNAGIYMIEPEVLKMIRAGRKVSMEREIFPILAKKHSLAGYQFSGHWFDIGNLIDYRKANFLLLQEDGGTYRSQGEVSRSAIVRPPVYVGKRATIANSTVGPFLLLGEDACIKNRAHVSESIIFDNVTIGESSHVTGCIVGSEVIIGKHVRVESGSVISPNVKVSDGVRIGRNAIIHPYKEINEDVKSGANIM
jgi:mannose-1-phosphate guanylyltransferase/phosphomannomutase